MYMLFQTVESLPSLRDCVCTRQSNCFIAGSCPAQLPCLCDIMPTYFCFQPAADLPSCQVCATRCAQASSAVVLARSLDLRRLSNIGATFGQVHYRLSGLPVLSNGKLVNYILIYITKFDLLIKCNILARRIMVQVSCTSLTSYRIYIHSMDTRLGFASMGMISRVYSIAGQC